ncbi:MAG: hypothetical protein HQL56_12065 [Magnetococcales bacterium]|nr:hypothetical protein [Magnetococcales bacterium]
MNRAALIGCVAGSLLAGAAGISGECLADEGGQSTGGKNLGKTVRQALGAAFTRNDDARDTDRIRQELKGQEQVLPAEEREVLRRELARKQMSQALKRAEKVVRHEVGGALALGMAQDVPALSVATREWHVLGVTVDPVVGRGLIGSSRDGALITPHWKPLRPTQVEFRFNPGSEATAGSALKNFEFSGKISDRGVGFESSYHFNENLQFNAGFADRDGSEQGGRLMLEFSRDF